MKLANMNSDRRFVLDTCALIDYFNDVFEVDRILSPRACGLIEQALTNAPSYVKLSIPSVVFVEIFEKWLTNEEFTAKFRYEVFERIVNSPNVEIKPLEQEVIECLLDLGDELRDHDLHDKIILASAKMLNCRLITIDSKIIAYVATRRTIPPTIE
jgi:predicted nucleic acid-binding protein